MNDGQGLAAQPVTRVDVRVRELDGPVMRRHSGGGIHLQTTLTLGAIPTLDLSWGIQQRFWNCQMLVFHNQSGFSPSSRPHDLHAHGQLIIETKHNSSRRLRLTEGMHYYTCLLRRPELFGIFEWRSQPVRFLVEVPSLDVLQKRLNDELAVAQLVQKGRLLPITQATERNEAKVRWIESRKQLEAARKVLPAARPEAPAKPRLHPATEAELDGIDSFLEMVAAVEKKRSDILNDPRFKSLSPEMQKTVLDRMNERLDESEMSARQDLH